MFRTYVLGRSEDADLIVNHDSISRRHLEVTLTDAGRYFCIDCASTGGSYVWRADEWQAINQGYVEPDEIVLLGKKKLDFSDVVSMVKNIEHRKPPLSKGFSPLSFRPRRNSATGEVE